MLEFIFFFLIPQIFASHRRPILNPRGVAEAGDPTGDLFRFQKFTSEVTLGVHFFLGFTDGLKPPTVANHPAGESLAI